MSLFRGYVITKNKQSTEKFKGVDDLKTYEEVKDHDEFAGILDTTTILLDFDDTQQAEKALKIVQDLKLKCQVRKTSRGIHIFFKNNGVKTAKTATRLACGLRADIKLGARNGYAIVKINGEERPVIYDSGDYENVPLFFTPLDSTIELNGLNEGENRNQRLFGYILPLQKNGFSKEDAKACLKVINKYVFDTPLPESEMKSILRDDSFSTDFTPTFFNGKTFMFDKFAEYIREKAGVVKINNQLHIYRDGIYVDSMDMIESEMIRLIKGLKRSQRTEVLDYLNILITENKEQSPPHLIAFKNGIYDVIHDELLPFSDKYIITNKINHNFNALAQSELVDETLNKLACDDPEIRSLLEEAIGYCFFRRNELGKAFVLVGDGSRERGASNGKSTFLTTLKAILGEDNITSLDMSELNQKFQNAELFGKLANIGDDIDDGYIPNSAIFKKLVTGERIQVQRKGERPFEFNNYAKMFFAANEVPRIKDRGGAIQRRLVIVPFLAHFSKDDPDYRPYITTELQQAENIEYLIQLGIKGLKRVLENNAFTESEKVEVQLKEFEEANNPVYGFFEELNEDDIINQTNKSVYLRYTVYCAENNYTPMGNIAFSKQIIKRFNLAVVTKNVNKTTCRVYVKKA